MLVDAPQLFSRAGLIPSQHYNFTTGVLAVSTQYTFTAPATRVIVNVGGTTPAIVYVSTYSPATTSSFAINQSGSPGQWTYDGPALAYITLLGASAAGTWSIFAY